MNGSNRLRFGAGALKRVARSLPAGFLTRNQEDFPVSTRVGGVGRPGERGRKAWGWKKIQKRNEKELRSSGGGVLKGVARNKAISGRN